MILVGFSNFAVPINLLFIFHLNDFEMFLVIHIFVLDCHFLLPFSKSC